MSFNPRQDFGSAGLVYDKIYSSVAEMNLNANTDGIMIGRYVMVSGETAGKDNTAIYQKRAIYTDNNYEIQYKYITHLGVFDSDAVPKAFITTDEYNNFHFMTQQEDEWIEIKPNGNYTESVLRTDENGNYVYDNENHILTDEETQVGPIFTHKQQSDLEKYTQIINGIEGQPIDLTKETIIGGIGNDSTTGNTIFKMPIIQLDSCGHLIKIKEQIVSINDNIININEKKWKTIGGN